MSNVIKFPVIAGVEVTTDSDGRFNLNALHRASGGEKKNGPSYWLAIESTKALVGEVEKQQADTGKSVSALSVLKGGAIQGTFAHELLAISYAGWISPAFQLKVNRVFMDYRTGKLSPIEPSAGQMSIPKSFAEALRLAADLAEENTLLEHRIQEDAPKVAFARQVEVAEDAITVAQAAKILDTGRKRLFAFMREIGWVNRYNQPYQSRIEAGYLDVKIGSWEHPDHGLRQSVTALVTGKGLVKLQKMWQELRPNRAA